MEARDLSAPPPARSRLDVTDAEIRTVQWCCCLHPGIDLSDIERALLRQGLDRLPPQSCPTCGRRMVLASLPPTVDVVECPYCLKPVPHDNTQRMLAMEHGVGRWAHPACAMERLGHRTAIQGWQTEAGHPDCAECGRPWDEHLSFGHETRLCPIGDGKYHRATGIMGVASPSWLVQS